MSFAVKVSRSAAARVAASAPPSSGSVGGGGRRLMSANAKVWIDKDTKVICQGFTGKQVRSDVCCEVMRL